MKPPVPYFGGKQALAPWIVDMLPPHGHYVEPYCGSLAVLLAKPPSPLETVNDLNRELVTFWRVLRDRPDDLIRACALTPSSCAELDAAFEPGANELETARRVFIRLTQARRNALQRRTGWRRIIAPSHGTSLTDYLAAFVDRLAPAAERLIGVSLECLPALEVIRRYGADPGVLLYVDPPYLASTRNSTHYRIEMKAETEHRDLAKTLLDCSAAVVLSGYDSPLYAELYDGWYREAIGTTVGNSADGNTVRAEVLWSNRPLGAQGVLDLGGAA